MATGPVGGPHPAVALAHEWLAGRHGSEKTFAAMAAAFPEAALHALTWDRAAGPDLGGRPVATTVLQRIGPLRDHRALQLPLMPLAWRYASRRHYDVVITSSHACAKGFWPARRAVHLCYCYTPMRYLWLASVDGRGRPSRARAPVERWLRSWDLASVRWVDEFAAISTAVAARIRELYGREAAVIHPPVDTDHFTPAPVRPVPAYALAVSRMVPYKRLDLAIRACHRAGIPLVVAGGGPQEQVLRALAGRLGADVRFVVDAGDDELRDLYRQAAVVVFPAEEDFGIVPVEAQACGVPVVALARGGTVDTVVPGVTGVLVADQDEEAFAEGVAGAVAGRFDPGACRDNALRFSAGRFRDRFVDWVVTSAAARGAAVADPRTAQPA